MAGQAGVRGRRSSSQRWLSKVCSRPIICRWLRLPCIVKGDSPDEWVESQLGRYRWTRKHFYIYGGTQKIFLLRGSYSFGQKLIVAGRCSRAGTSGACKERAITGPFQRGRPA
ncbi:hypothetical protein DPMN_125344 [Dreissena polymorpha]|uniref:Uncharacterized protein n=1 Tax=Dreissena polymorpha TaxID=45954 RepID=A0A9D4JX02_DREPO|nr:hypothetical protein DPMN_125344 [Dreissena polymorpha]